MTLPRLVPAVLLTGAAALMFAVPAHATPSTPMVPSSIGPIPASAAMPRGDEAVHPNLNCYDSGQPGGPIAQSTVLARAAVWVAQNVPYTGACAQEPGGNYRLDCSGFVSMAWGLSTSLSSYDFNPNINGGDSRFQRVSLTNLRPGDAVVADNSTAHHIALFTGWGSNDNGQHRYGNISQESTYGTGTIAVYNQDLMGRYWGQFTPIHYTNVRMQSYTPGATTVWTGTAHRAFSVAVSGELMTSDSTSWQDQDDLGGPVTGTPGVTYRLGRFDVFAVSPTGSLMLRSYVADVWNAWSQMTVGAGQWQPGVVAVWTGTRNEVFGHNGAGHLLHAYDAGNSWTVEDLGGITYGTPGAVYRNGGIAVFSVAPSSGYLYQQTTTADGGWSGWQVATLLGRYGGRGVTAVWTGTACDVFAFSPAGNLYRVTRTGQWVGPQSLNANYPGSVGGDYDGQYRNVFGPSATGIYRAKSTDAGGWSAWTRVV